MSDNTDGPRKFYPGIGSDTKIKELNELVGEITAKWANIEDGLFNIFLIALNGSTMNVDFRPFRAVFFTFNSYEQKRRMIDSAMKARFFDKADILNEWRTLRKALDEFSKIRNEVAHLVPRLKSTTNPDALANVRLVPPFWKSMPNSPDEFDQIGYSIDQLRQAVAPFWGYHPKFTAPESAVATFALGYRVQEFSRKIDSNPLINTGSEIM